MPSNIFGSTDEISISVVSLSSISLICAANFCLSSYIFFDVILVFAFSYTFITPNMAFCIAVPFLSTSISFLALLNTDFRDSVSLDIKIHFKSSKLTYSNNSASSISSPLAFLNTSSKFTSSDSKNLLSSILLFNFLICSDIA